jgi:ATP-dependent HslUV protease subunit HslV
MTTVLGVRRDGKTAVAADGQVTFGSTIVKHGAAKVRRIADGRVVVGFAGAAADALALLERFEGFVQKHPANIARAAVELAKEWRLDRALRRLESVLLVADRGTLLLVSGSGEVVEPDDGIAAIGSGGPAACAAARALVAHTTLDAAQIAREALRIAAGLDVYTNERIRVEVAE